MKLQAGFFCIVTYKPLPLQGNYFKTKIPPLGKEYLTLGKVIYTHVINNMRLDQYNAYESISNYIRSKGIKKQHFADAIGVPVSYIYKYKNDGYDFTEDKLNQILKAYPDFLDYAVTSSKNFQKEPEGYISVGINMVVHKTEIKRLFEQAYKDEFSQISWT